MDYVISSQVLEHVASPGRYLREAHRMLKPGGKLLLSTHGLWPYHPTPTDFRRWTRAGLVAELEASGFRLARLVSILNEYSAAVNFFALIGEYRKTWKWFSPVVHVLAGLMIGLLERFESAAPDMPAGMVVVGVKDGESTP